MKVLLLSPTLPEQFKGSAAPPLGLGYIASTLKENGVDVSLLDCFNMSFEDCAKAIKQNKPDIIGITCNTGIRHESLKLAKIAKTIDPDVIVVMGGPHVTAFPEQILKHFPQVDIIVRGEGELTFLEIVQSYQNNSNNSLQNVAGLSFRSGANIIHTQDREFIRDLDTLPFPSWEFFPLEEYNKHKNKKNWDVNKSLLKLKSVPMITSRGCPFDCSFCYSHFWGKKYRTRSAKNIVDEMEFLHSNYGIEYIRFFDDNFTHSKKRTINICNEIIKRGLHKKLMWRCEGRVNDIDTEICSALKKAGCHLIEFGVESGSPEILKNINKKFTIKQIENAFKAARNSGLETKALLLVGSPGETIETLKNTLNILKKIKPTYVVPSILLVMPKTKLSVEMKAKGQITDDIWLNENVIFPIYTAEYTEEQLKNLFTLFYRDLLIQRKDIVTLFHSGFRYMIRNFGIG